MRIVTTSLLLATLVPAPLFAHPTIEQALEGRTAGAPRSCIPEPQIDSTQTFDSGAILYRMKSGPDYLDTPPDCRGTLRRDSAIASRTPSTSLCRGDILQVFDPLTHTGYGSCALGDFVPYARVNPSRR